MTVHPWVAALERRRRHGGLSCPRCSSGEVQLVGFVPAKTARFTERVRKVFRRGWVEVPAQSDQQKAKQLLSELGKHNPADLSLLVGPEGEAGVIAEVFKLALQAIANGLPVITAQLSL